VGVENIVHDREVYLLLDLSCVLAEEDDLMKPVDLRDEGLSVLNCQVVVVVG
jgi:hypothetical protein